MAYFLLDRTKQDIPLPRFCFSVLIFLSRLPICAPILDCLYTDTARQWKTVENVQKNINLEKGREAVT